MSQTLPFPPADPDWSPQTRLVHAGQVRSQFEETAEALYLTSGFTYQTAEEAEAAFVNEGSRFVYSRFRNPTVAMFEDRMAAYEGVARGFATASGMAAVAGTVFGLLKAGDRLVAPRALFGSCYVIVKDLAPKFGIESVLIDGTDPEQWREALAKPTNLVFLESPSNPCMEVVDLKLVCDLAHQAGAKVAVDNVFATPVLQRPRDFGVDIIIYSATKHIDGQGRTMGGIILCDNDVAAILGPFLRHTGPALAPFNAWVMLKGLETLELRVNAQSASALEIARFLEGHKAVGRVLYPGLESHPQHAVAMRQMKAGGNLVTFDVAAGADRSDTALKARAFKLANALKIAKISNNIGDSKTLITHPATTTHHRVPEADRKQVGIYAGTLRLSVGLEATGDLIRDLQRGLDPLL